jgi:hypothetical protein
MLRTLLKHIKFHWPMALFLTAYFIVALATFRDFGIPNTYNDYYSEGISYLEHVFGRNINIGRFDFFEREKINEIDQLSSPIYGLFPATQIIFNFTGDPEIFNLLNLFFFSLVPIFAYVLLYRKYRSPVLALLGPIFIVINPRLLGHAAINPQNMFFVVVYFISVIAIIYQNKKSKNILNSFFMKVFTLGVLFGISQTVNVFGYSLYLIFLFLSIHTLIFRYGDSTIKNKFIFLKNSLMELIIIAVIAHFFMMLTFPFLSGHFVFKLGEFFNKTFLISNESQPVLFFGEEKVVSSFKYLLSLNAFTIPVTILVLLPISIYFIFKKFRDEVYALLLFIIVTFVIFFSLVEINTQQGVQGTLFLIPIISMFTAVILIELFLEARNSSLTNMFSLVVFSTFLFTARDIVTLHPYEYNYFNELGGGFNKLSDYFEKDNLGISYKEALNKIPFTEKTQTVYTCENYREFKKYVEKKEYLEITTNKDNADYIICQYPVYDIEPYEYVSREEKVLNTVVRISY